MNAARQLPLRLPHEPSFAREDFLAHPSNAAALALVESAPDWPAPLMLLVGPPGAGKSHLAAIFTATTGALALRPDALDPQAATRAPAWTLDDADALAGGEAALFHVLNLAAAHGVRVLMTAQRPPAFWGVATPDLASRLRLAPVIEIAPPDEALVAAVLTKLFSDRQLQVEPALVAYLARRLDRSLAAARRLVEALDDEALSQGRKVTRAMAAPFLAADED